MEIPARAEFIDLIFLILCLRIIYISVSRGIVQESFKLIGLLVASFFAFHYYSLLGDAIQNKISFLNREYLYFTSFLLILLGVRTVFNLLRLIVTLLFKIGHASPTERWLGLFLGGVRAVFLSSIIIFLLVLSPLNPKYFSNSLSYAFFKNIAPKIYLLSYNLYSKFNSSSVSNEEVERYYKTLGTTSEQNKKG